MRRVTRENESGSTIVIALGTIMVISLIGANVLINCTKRYNAASKQVKGWKEALYAAEAGGEIGYAETRKYITARPGQFSAAHGWTAVTGTPNPTWTKSLPAFGEGNSLTSEIRVDQFDNINGNPYYRIRATGYARVFGLRAAGMDDTLAGVPAGNRFSSTARARGSGDSLLRKIDFNYDHYIATHGNGDGVGKQLVSVPVDADGNKLARVSRRIELIAVPVMSFDAALKATTGFSGPGSAGVVDSYHSQNGIYPGRSVATTPSHIYYADARNGNISVGGPTFGQGGYIYGDVTTNGGTVTKPPANISGTVDNNVAFTVPPQLTPNLPPGLSFESQSSGDITPPVRFESDGVTRKTEFWYLYPGSVNGITFNPVYDSGTPIETEINLIVNGDVSGNADIIIRKGVTAKVYFKGNINKKARDFMNQNEDGYGSTTGVKKVNPDRDNNPATNDSYVASDNTSRAGHMQFYGISPTNGSSQTISVGPPGDIWGVFYAPSADWHMNGNPDLYGAIVCKSFHGNGNTSFHFDKALAGVGEPREYRLAHYIEDVR